MVDTLNIAYDDDGVAMVTLSRPKVHNAFNDDLIWELEQAFLTLGKDPSIRAIVLTGAGKSFSAGADLNWMKEAASYSEAQNLRDARQLSSMLNTIDTCPKPTLAVVNGPALGGGAGLVACCDIVLAVETATFAFSEVRLGLTPATISPYVVAAIGARAARRYFLTAERFDVYEAKRIGLVHEIVPSLHGACSLSGIILKNILAGAPEAQAEAKSLIRDVADKAITSALREETALQIADRRSSAEGREGIAAFLEKRLPSWGVKA